MPIAAVPEYLQKNDPEFYLSAPPGHRFLLYFSAWGENHETGKLDWRMKDRVPKMKKRKGLLVQEGWEDIPNDQYACTISACKTPGLDENSARARKPKADPGLGPWKPIMKALHDRQASLRQHIGEETVLTLDAVAISPFTTGLGNEHPLENGFAFLNPYGLPYLPGSGVKGALRQAARELASGEWGERHGWSDGATFTINLGKDKKIALTLLDLLFGKESKDGGTEHVRGVLSFWDVIPQIEGDSLMVEIMTPHQSHYYQQKGQAGSISPHDSGQPTPISYLTVPPGSGFVFHVQCNTTFLARIAPELVKDDKWKALIQSVFEHAFAWCGFGAKTAVGYGAMESEAQREARRHEAGLQAAREREEKNRQNAAQQQADAQPWPGARLKFNRANGTLTAEKDGKAANAIKPKGEELLATLPDTIKQRVMTNQFVKVTAYVFGNTLVRVEVP